MLNSFISYGYLTDKKLNKSLQEKNIIPIPITTIYVNSKSETNLKLIYQANLQQISTTKSVIKLRIKPDYNYLNTQEITSLPPDDNGSEDLMQFFSGFSSFSGSFDITLKEITSDYVLTFALDLFQDDNPSPVDTKETSIFVKYFEGNSHEL